MPEISAVPATSEISNRTLDSSSSQTQAIIMHPAEPDSAGPQHAQVYSPCAGFTVEHEFDILPAFCGLIKKYDKVICYAAYPQSVLDMLGGLVSLATKDPGGCLTNFANFRFVRSLADKSSSARVDFGSD